uniref:DEK_C domain-containing protein n=1 Tax=Strongyloides papillosus TaxID=174720 RepID=A0A0N5B4K2_STREA
MKTEELKAICTVKSLTKAALVRFILEQELPNTFTVRIRQEIEALFGTMISIPNPDATAFARNYVLAANELLYDETWNNVNDPNLDNDDEDTKDFSRVLQSPHVNLSSTSRIHSHNCFSDPDMSATTLTVP